MPKTISLLIVALIIFITLGACNNKIATPDNQPIKIGLIGPYTGEAATLGIPSKTAIEYATETLNLLGGINGQPVQLAVEDGQCDPKIAASAIHKLIEIDNVKFIIGGFCSSETLGIAPIAEEKKVILLSPGSSHPDITNAGDYVFRNYPSDNYQGRFAADYIYHQLNVKNVSVIATNLDYPQGIKQTFIDSFEKLGGIIDHRLDIGPQEKEFSTCIAKIKQKKSQLIYLSTNSLNQAIEVIKTAKESGIEIPFFGPESWDDEPTIQTNVRLFEGSYYSPIISPWTPDIFRNEIKKRCLSCDIMPATLQSYDAVFVLAQAIKKGGFDIEATRQALYNTSYDGLSGHIEFDSNGDLKQVSYQVKKIEAGQIKIIYP